MTCKDCIHYDVCAINGIDVEDTTFKKELCCGEFKDKSRIIELPCNMGDTVYHTTTFGICQLTVASIHLFWDKRKTRIKRYSYIVGLNNLDYTYRLPLKEIGKTVFLTKEQAEAKLKELKE